MTGNISKSPNGLKGDRGEKFTYDDFTSEQLDKLKPVKGVDYWTEEDKTEVKVFIGEEAKYILNDANDYTDKKADSLYCVKTLTPETPTRSVELPDGNLGIKSVVLRHSTDVSWLEYGFDFYANNSRASFQFPADSNSTTTVHEPKQWDKMESVHNVSITENYDSSILIESIEYYMPSTIVEELFSVYSVASRDVQNALLNAKNYTDKQLKALDLSAAVEESKAYTDEKVGKPTAIGENWMESDKPIGLQKIILPSATHYFPDDENENSLYISDGKEQWWVYTKPRETLIFDIANKESNIVIKVNEATGEETDIEDTWGILANMEKTVYLGSDLGCTFYYYTDCETAVHNSREYTDASIRKAIIDSWEVPV